MEIMSLSLRFRYCGIFMFVAAENLHFLQGGEARSRSAGGRGRGGGSSTCERKRVGVGRTSSLRRGVGRGGSFKEENAAGPVSVHVKQVFIVIRYMHIKSGWFKV